MSTLLDGLAGAAEAETTTTTPETEGAAGAAGAAAAAGEAAGQEQQQTEGEGAAGVPENYTVDLPEDLQAALAGGGVLAEDPVFQGFVDHAKTIGMSQEQFGGIMNWAADLVKGHSAATAESQMASQQKEMKALQTAFGAQLPAVAKTVKAYTNVISAQVPGAAPILDLLGGSAAGVQLLHAMASGTLKPAVSGNLPGAADMGGAAALTEEDLRSMVADPKYWKDKDPAFIKKVNEGFKRLYPSNSK